MKFESNITPVPGTKRYEYTCNECGIKKESYKGSSGNYKKYCSSKCGAIAHGPIMKAKLNMPMVTAVQTKLTRRKLENRVTTNCLGCGTLFTKYQAPNAPPVKYCTRKCFENPKKKQGEKWKCIGCAQIFHRKKRPCDDTPTYCTVVCKNKNLTNLGQRVKRNIKLEVPNNYAEVERSMFARFMPILDTASFIFSLVNMLLILYFVLGGSNLNASDTYPTEIPERICRSPKSFNLSGRSVYSAAADALGTTPDIVKEVVMLKVENYEHVIAVVNDYDAYESERSRTFLMAQVNRLLGRNLKAWAEYCND